MNGIIPELLSELNTFPGREEELRKIKRWSLYPVMFYRPSLFSHSKHVAWLVASLAPLLKEVSPGIDIKRAAALALVHDDAELITGDHQAGNKANMNKGQLAKLDEEEREAIKLLTARFPKILGGYNYKDLLNDVLDRTSPEARIAKYFDRIDAIGEGHHELYAGNISLTRSVVNEFGTAPLFYKLYETTLDRMLETYPELRSLRGRHNFFKPLVIKPWKTLATTFSPHTKGSLYKVVGHPQYDAWKKIMLESDDGEEIENLYTQREFL